MASFAGKLKIRGCVFGELTRAEGSRTARGRLIRILAG